MPVDCGPFDGAALKAARLRKGWKQVKLAHVIGAHNVTVCKWEKGDKTPSLGYRLRLAQVLDAPELVNGGDLHVTV